MCLSKHQNFLQYNSKFIAIDKITEIYEENDSVCISKTDTKIEKLCKVSEFPALSIISLINSPLKEDSINEYTKWIPFIHKPSCVQREPGSLRIDCYVVGDKKNLSFKEAAILLNPEVPDDVIDVLINDYNLESDGI